MFVNSRAQIVRVFAGHRVTLGCKPSQQALKAIGDIVRLALRSHRTLWRGGFLNQVVLGVGR